MSFPGTCPSPPLPGLFSRLAKVLSVPVEDIEQKVPPKSYRSFQPIEVMGGVSLQTISAIAEHAEDFTGVRWHNKPIRSYVESGTLAHVIGYVGDINREELQVLYNKGYAPGTALGKSGHREAVRRHPAGQGRQELPGGGREGKGRGRARTRRWCPPLPG